MTQKTEGGAQDNDSLRGDGKGKECANCITLRTDTDQGADLGGGLCWGKEAEPAIKGVGRILGVKPGRERIENRPLIQTPTDGVSSVTRKVFIM